MLLDRRRVPVRMAGRFARVLVGNVAGLRAAVFLAAVFLGATFLAIVFLAAAFLTESETTLRRPISPPGINHIYLLFNALEHATDR